MSISQVPLSRRRFIVGAGALVIGAYLPSTGALARSAAPATSGAAAFDANAFVQIGADGVVTVISKHTEVGQGVYTGMATLVAEELDADWAQVRVVAAPVDTNIYKNLTFGFQGTGGSSSVANAYEQMRRMGAMARALLVQAAAQSWKTSAQEITVQAGKIRHAASGREAGFGEFAALAATLPPPDPASLTLKDPANFTLIGKTRGLHRVDSLAKTNGSAQFSQDIHEPGMLTVTIKKPPRFGGKVATFDAERALAVPGVVAVKQVATGVAVYAKNTWAAIQGRERLKVTWDDAQAERRNTEEIYAEFRQVAQKTGVVAKSLGKPDEVFDKADKVIEAEYTFPYVAHAPMEPLDGYLFWDGESVKARYGCQIQTLDHKQLCDLFELPPDKVQIETILAGGSFGRRIDLGNPTLGWFAANITPDKQTGIGGWSDQQLSQYLATGHAPGRSSAAGPMAEAVENSLQFLTPEDNLALVKYLRDIEPIAGDGAAAVNLQPKGAGASTPILPGGQDSSLGRRVFANDCSGCHQWNGPGRQSEYASLVGSTAVNDPQGRSVVQAILKGTSISIGDRHEMMPAFGSAYSDEEVAAVANFVVGHFGDKQGNVTAKQVAEQRKQ